MWVHSPDKVGRDAGDLAGIGPIGLAATDDVDALLALGPDCVVYAASGPDLDAAAVPDYERMLARRHQRGDGRRRRAWCTRRATTTRAWWPSSSAPPTQGGATLYASGVEPGFAADQLPLTLLTLSTP